MRRLRLRATAVLSVSAFVLAGCSGAGPAADIRGGAARSKASASPSPSPSASASPPASPGVIAAPAPAPVPTLPCTSTTGLDATALADYLKGLKSSDRADSQALFMVDDGLYLRLVKTQPPCEPVPVKLGFFRVDMTHSTDSAGYKFTYTPIRTLTLAVGPADGKVDGSLPPAPSGCGGILSVAYVGRDLGESDLPHSLRLPAKDSTLDWVLIDVERDGVLDAVFKPPSGARDC
ncbi:hypothetical protein [Streptomyces sp. NPDC056387]|uniref:hypothetical protein n=1 Tax=Streptomyces sp. NPDC056387 TaxID=3345803 RepID=UPI0035DA4063